jgi:hypothetical protein
MNEHIKLSKEEIAKATEIYNKRIEYLVKLGEVKLSEINNEKTIEETYFNLIELNTRENQLMGDLIEMYGEGSIDLSAGFYIKKT